MDPMRHRSRFDQTGFTLIELMIVVAVIAILAAVVIPSFMTDSAKSKARSETSAVFAEFSSKEEQYHSDYGTYRASSTTCPSTPSGTAQSIATCLTNADWLALRIASPSNTLACTYAVTTGAAGVNPNPPSPFVLATSPASTWYYIFATCNFKNSATNSTYLTSNLDSKIQASNEGK
jgi:prepilin-type N-terminal cleavage/methylation domain-containing protein